MATAVSSCLFLGSLQVEVIGEMHPENRLVDCIWTMYDGQPHRFSGIVSVIVLEHGVPVAARVVTEELKQLTEAVLRSSAGWAELFFPGQAVSFAVCEAFDIRHNVDRDQSAGYHREAPASSTIKLRMCSTPPDCALSNSGIIRVVHQL
mmetsp:Transcript_2237/g.8760  ORF Transcript_2237/g.8760 Transcript_2237/m.8760 type:complete len:149 (+) Transcript_2237:105-551(+)